MNGIKILVLEGSKYEMGIEYGKQLKEELQLSLAILKKFFVEENNISLAQLTQEAESFYNRYPPNSYQEFIEGITVASNLSLIEIKILNAMEILRRFIDGQASMGACSFIAIPGSKTISAANILGRNYDYQGLPYKLIAKNLVVTILKEVGTVATAFIAMPGQIYAPTCINANSLFLELNNAMPSGGFLINYECPSLLVNLLISMQHSQDFAQLDRLLSTLNSDFSLVINAADQHNIKSYEYSAFNGMKTYLPEKNTSFASTNFYLHQDWNLEDPTDERTWFGVLRRSNLLLQIAKDNYSSKDVMNFLDIKLADGGAKLDYTIYQIVFDTKTQDLYLKITGEDKNWTHIELAKLFSKGLEI